MADFFLTQTELENAYLQIANNPLQASVAIDTVLTAVPGIHMLFVTGTTQITLPPADDRARASLIIIINTGAGVVTVVPAGTDTINGAASVQLCAQYCGLRIKRGAINTWLVPDSLTP